MSARVAVEFPIEEAKALSAAALFGPRREAIEGQERLGRALAVETGPCGSAEQPSLADQAEGLIGRKVRVLTTTGAYKRGTLARVSSYHTLVLADHMGDNPISLTLVKAIEPEREGVAA